MDITRICPAGEYVGVYQGYVGSESDNLASSLCEVKITISNSHNLIHEIDGHKTLLIWEEKKWVFRPEYSDMKFEAIPKLYGALLVIEYLVYERGAMSYGSRFYLVKTKI